MNDIKEKVAAGLRNMKNKPDALLFVDGREDWTWDEKDVYGTPVFHTESVNDSLWGGQLTDILFIPIWSRDGENYCADRRRFIEGYEGEA